MADSLLRIASPRATPQEPQSSSTSQDCIICQETYKKKRGFKSCKHEFCHRCLLEWYTIKGKCPPCKQTFMSIMYDILSRSADEQDMSTQFRRSIYNDNLWVVSQADFAGRDREVTAAYFRDNPAARFRLVPWLNRELSTLLFENRPYVMYLVNIIMGHLLRNHIYSSDFRELLSRYLGQNTDHFIHEFDNFMRSPYDMLGYDRHVSYHVDLSNNDDSDVKPGSSTTPQNSGGSSSRINALSGLAPPRAPPTIDPVVVDLVDTDPDEPIFVSEIQHHPPHHHQPPPQDTDKERRKRRHHRVAPSSLSTTTSSSFSSSDEDDPSYRRKQRKTSPKRKIQ